MPPAFHRRPSGHALVLAALVAASACAGSGGPIEIGLAGPLSEARGIAMQHGAELAVGEINAHGGIHGRPLRLLAADDSGSPDAAIRVAGALRDNPRVVAVVGHLTSGASIVAAQVYGAEPNPLVMLSPSASSPDLSAQSPYAFRLCPTDSSYGVALARYARQALGARRAGLIFVSNDYGRGIRTAFRSAFERIGGTVIEADPYVPAVFSVEPYLARLARSGPDVLMLATERDGAELVLRQMRALGLHWPTLGADALTGIEAAGPDAEGIHVATAYLPAMPGERNQAFTAAFGRAFGGERPDYRAAGAYDAVILLAQAIAAAGAERPAVRAYLAQVGTTVPAFEGVTGRIAFDTAGDVPAKNVVIGVVHAGALVPESAP